MMRFLAPAGMPLNLDDFLAGMRSLWNPAGDGVASAMPFTGARHVFGASSGRAALVIIFQALRRLSPERSVVAIPGYTCYSVAAAAARAGLRVYPLEMNSASLDIDYESAAKAPYDQFLAVLTANLFGFASDVGRLCELASKNGAFVVDDAAQSLGTCTNGQLSGTGTDVGLYSLARGKVLPVGGGLIVTKRDDVASGVAAEIEKLNRPGFADELRTYTELLGVSILFRPWLYWLPNRLPFLKLGITEFDTTFRVERMARVSSGMLPGKFATLNEITAGRAAKAAWLSRRLQAVSGFTVPEPPRGCRPSYIRFPVLARGMESRDWAVKALRDAGIGASAYYPSAMCDIPEMKPHLADGAAHCPGAEDLARRLLTLPVHPMVHESDMERICNILEMCPN
ncbi:MAG: DegT/DnrJ/EryC1/StrS family aminotransferase [Candidatus Korobacteraceae bacterium]